MKAKVHTNRVLIDYQPAFQKATDYFKRHKIDLTFDFEQSDLKDLKYIKKTLPQGERILLMPVANLLPTNNYDITMFVFNQEEFTPPNLPTGYCYFPFSPAKPFVDIGTHRNNLPQYTETEICHELMHSLVFLANQKGFQTQDVMDSYRENNNPDSPTGNFAEQWKLLAPYINFLQTQSPYKYFSSAEVAKWKLKPELWQALDKMREIASAAFIITSGFRTPQENLNVGGKPNSAHLRGLAVDLLCTDNKKRTKMIKGVLGSNISCFLEIAKKHLHIDLDITIHDLDQTILETNDD